MVAYSRPRGFFPMLVALLALLQVTVAVQHHAHRNEHMRPAPRNNDEMAARLKETQDALQKRAGRIRTSGVLGPTRGERMEIRDLAKNADQWNLYLLGMEYFKAMDHSDPLSYYQIAGIHGRPYVTWNGFGPLVNNAGFCPHDSILFISWHRPYLATFEQAWYSAVEAVIAQFPASQQARWTAARQGLRLPYWDWAVAPSDGNTVPTLIRDQYVTVTKPSGSVSIANPLYSYTFGTTLPAEIGGAPWSNWPITLRRPVANPTRSNNNEVASMLNSMRTNLRDRLYYIFLSKASLGYISNEQIGARTDIASVDSIESVHDAIHTTVGGESGGTMYYLDYSAFDPIFWLHHVMIDRLFAMYQLNSPNTYIANGVINRDMAQWSQGEAKNQNTPLKPFVSNVDTGSYYTSNDIKDTLLLGYYYADSTSTSAMVNAVNSKYSAGKNGLSRRDGEEKCEGRELQNGDYHTVLSIVADKYLMDGSYTVHCFLGSSNSTSNSTAPYGNSTSSAPYSQSTAPPAPTYSNSTGSLSHDYTQDPGYVGSYGILGMKAGNSNNKTANPQLTEGCVPLTSALQCKEAAGYVSSTAPKDTETYLKNNLYYKVVGPGGVEYNPADLPGFHVYVQSAPVTLAPSANEFPSIGDYIKLPSVTEGKPAGNTFTWTPGPYDYVGYNETDSYQYPPPAGAYPSVYPLPTGTSPAYPAGTMVFPKPEDEPGYCVSKQTVIYVNEAGDYLYSDFT